MKRTLTYALSAVLGAMAAPAFSQDAFPDTPDNHWAYEALANMKRAGLLVGYPDGLFRGSRPASRYELAVAVHATYMHLRNLVDGLEQQHDALSRKVDGMTTEGFATKAELQAVRDAMAALQTSINGMKSWGDDIASLKRMASTFERELASMGVDIEAMKRGLSELADRVAKLEGRKMPISITGDVNLAVFAGYSEDGRFGIDRSGRPTGVSRDGSFGPAGMTEDLSMYHEGTFKITNNDEDGPKLNAVLAVHNLFGGSSYLSSAFNSEFAFGDLSAIPSGIPYGEPSTDVYFQELNVKFNTSFLGQDFNATIGRQGKKLGGYFFRRPDTTPYYWSQYWDDGKWYFDGANFDFNFGNVNLDIFGGRQSNRLSTNGVELNPMFAGQYGHLWDPETSGITERPRGYGFHTGIMVDQHLGASVGIPLMERGKINLNYLILDQNATTVLSSSPLMAINRAIVFGGEAMFDLNDNLSLSGGFSQTNLNYNDSSVVDKDNTAWWAGIKFNTGNASFYAGYREIEPQFYAPGDWGRIGIWQNPTNIKGFNGGVSFDFSDRLAAKVGVGIYEGTGTTLGGVSGMTESDELRHVSGKVMYKLNDNWNVHAGAEFVDWDLASRTSFSGGKPEERWYWIGAKYRLGENAWWGFNWEMSDYDSKGVSGFTPFGSSATRATGGLFTSQVGFRF